MFGIDDLLPLSDHKIFEDLINKCHNIIRDEEFCTPEQVFDELSKILFCKLFDEQQVLTGDKSKLEFYCNELESDTDIANRIAGKDNDENDGIGIYNVIKRKYPFVFSKDKNEIRTIGLKSTTLKRLVLELQRYNLSKTNLDIKGSTYQVLIKNTFAGGKGLGQFFTPREIVKFIIDLIDPKIDEIIIDPACGTGGFLVEAISYVIRKYNLDRFKYPNDYAIHNVFGIDANEKMAWTAQINMIFHNDGDGHIFRHNSLDNLEHNDEFDSLKSKFKIIITNPPFGARETNMSILSNYELGSQIDERKSQSTEILFIERCLQMLEYGGRMGIILPDGILSNSSLAYVREFILREAVILAVISLPEDTFKPYGTSVKTSILIIKKRNEDIDTQGPVFMAEINNVGYDSTGKATDNSDFDEIVKVFKEFIGDHYAEVFK